MELKEILDKDPAIEIINFNFFPGIDDTVLNKLESKIKLPDTARSFYKETNGWQVRWLYKNNRLVSRENLIKNEPFDWMWPTEHYWQFDGVINILPIDYLLQKDWKDFVWFDFEQQYEITYKDKVVSLLDFKKSIKPFDLFDKYFTVAFYMEDENMPVLLGEDHNVEFLSYEPMTFPLYLNFLIENKGAVKSREIFFKKINA